MRFLAAIAVLILSCGLAAAERRVALVIGIDRYESLRPLDNAVNDARAIEDVLVVLGFDVTSETDRDLRRVRRAIEDFREDGAGADVALVFFAGHGVEIAGRNHLLPADADASSPEALAATSLPLEELRDAVAAIAPVGLILLDACRNDPFGTPGAQGPDGRGAAAMVLEAVRKAVRPGLARIGRADGALFAFAAAPGATASDGSGGNSPFTAALARYLGTEGLEIRSALTLVQQEVYDATRGAQLPYVESGLPRLFFAAAAQQALPERERLLLAMADVTPQMRAEVEAVASDADMPLAPLYAALLSADLAARDSRERRAELEAAADAFVKVRGQMRSLSSDDPSVTALRLRAEERLAVGAFAEVHAALSEAAALDAASRRSLRTNLEARTRSEAATQRLAAGAYEAALDYRAAIAAYRAAAALYDEIGADRRSDDDVWEAVQARRAVADLSRALGDLPAAEAALEAAMAVLEPDMARPRAGDDVERLLAGLQDDLGDIARVSGDLGLAGERHAAAMAIRRRLLDARPDSPARMRALAISLDYVGGVRSTREDAAGALEAYRSALELRLRARDADGEKADAAEVASDLAVSHFKVAHALSDLGDLPGAEEQFRLALAMDDLLVEMEPADPHHRRARSVTLNGLASLLKATGRTGEAIDLQTRIRDDRAALAAAHPDIAALQWDVGAADRELGLGLRAAGETEAAVAALSAAHDRLTPLAAASPGNVAWRYDLAVVDYALGNLVMAQGDPASAVPYYRAARDGWAAVSARDPASERFRDVLAAAAEGLGQALHAAGDGAGAAAALAEALEFRLALAAALPDAERRFAALRAHVNLANIGIDARDHFGRALAIAEELERTGMLGVADAAVPAQLRAALDQLSGRP